MNGINPVFARKIELVMGDCATHFRVVAQRVGRHVAKRASEHLREASDRSGDARRMVRYIRQRRRKDATWAAANLLLDELLRSVKRHMGAHKKKKR